METYEVILLCEYGTAGYGDIIKVPLGIYNTLLNLGKAIPLEELNEYDGDFSDCQISQYEKMVIHSKITMEDNERLFKENEHLKDKIDRLTEKVEELSDKPDPTAGKKAYYDKNKMMSNYGTKSNK